jgi:hypothetical protein
MLSPLGTSTTSGLLYQPRMIDDECGAVGGMRNGKGNRSTRRKPASLPLSSPRIPHDLTWDRTRPATVEVSDWPHELWAQPYTLYSLDADGTVKYEVQKRELEQKEKGSHDDKLANSEPCAWYSDTGSADRAYGSAAWTVS